jgi:hypothetical protein
MFPSAIATISGRVMLLAARYDRSAIDSMNGAMPIARRSM